MPNKENWNEFEKEVTEFDKLSTSYQAKYQLFESLLGSGLSKVEATRADGIVNLSTGAKLKLNIIRQPDGLMVLNGYTGTGLHTEHVFSRAIETPTDALPADLKNMETDEILTKIYELLKASETDRGSFVRLNV